MEIKRPLIFSVLAIGAASIAAQIVLLREFMIVFYGNEISVGLALGAWLCLGAIGSLLPGRFSDRISGRIWIFCAFLLFLGVFLPFAVPAIRYIRPLTGFAPGEIMPLGILIASSAIVLAPICVTLGFLFAFACAVYPARDLSLKVGGTYMFESIGAAAGGLCTSFFLIKYLGSVQILVLLGILSAFLCALLTYAVKEMRIRITIRTLSILWLLALLWWNVTGKTDFFERTSIENAWRPFSILVSKNSIYGNVIVAKKESQISFFTNGLYAFTVPDQLSQEEAVHFALSGHENPKSILLIGGGTGGLLWELLKYPAAKIDYVELDPLLIELGRRYLSSSPYYALDDPRVKIINTDGRFFIKNTASRYDVVLIHIPNPYTAQLNRLYTKEFFEEAKKVMKEDAVLSFGVTSSENYISPELGGFLGSLYNTLSAVFDDVAFIPGDTAYFMASMKKGSLTVDYKEISKRLSAKKIEAAYVNETYLFSKLSPDMLQVMRDALARNRDARINLDFRPISYYYDMILWSTYFGSFLRRLPALITPRRIWLVFLLLYAAAIAGGFLLRGRGGIRTAALLAIATTGFSGIVFEIAIILSFQIIYGFLYYELGLILTSFMIGLFLGSKYIMARLDRIKIPVRDFMKIQVGIALYPFLLPIVLFMLAHSSSPGVSFFGSNIIFPALPIVAGFLGGAQFPLGNKIFRKKGSGPGKAGGTTYGADLIGACLGAAIVSAILVPIIGIFQTCIAVGLLNLSLLLMLALNEKDKIS